MELTITFDFFIRKTYLSYKHFIENPYKSMIFENFDTKCVYIKRPTSFGMRSVNILNLAHFVLIIMKNIMPLYVSTVLNFYKQSLKN